MYEMEEGYVAVAEGCTEIDKSTNLAHTVIGVFYSAEDAMLACELRARHLNDCIAKDSWDLHGEIWSTRTDSGETMYGVTHIGEEKYFEIELVIIK